MTSRPPVVQVRDLQKSYGSVAAVRGVSFSIAAGETFALLGPNGAGKSTTIEILEGYRDRTGGEVIAGAMSDSGTSPLLAVVWIWTIVDLFLIPGMVRSARTPRT